MKKAIFFLGYLFVISIGTSNAQSFSNPNFGTTPIGTWMFPVGATFTKDGQKLFVWEQSGKVYVCNRDGSGNYIKQTTPVLDISQEVGFWRDHGLLGFTLDPQFNINGLIYLLYVVDRHHLINFGTGSYNPATNDYYKATIGRVTRYQTSLTGSDLLAVPASRTILIGETKSTGIPILHESHGVGALAFCADGMLLVSAGDGASYNIADTGSISHTYFAQGIADGIIRDQENKGAFRSQMINSHNGKLLRINPTNGNGVGSNPFFDPLNPRSPQSRVWALGFRNPFRIAVKPGSGSTNPSTGDIGEVFVGDVGWNQREELNIIKAPGQNCGWPLYEGVNSLGSYYTVPVDRQSNEDEPNPLGAGCSTPWPYYTFSSLLKQATADEITTIYNPCNSSSVIGTNNRFYHRRPVLDWSHSGNVTRVPKFTGNASTQYTIGTTESGVTGTSFGGNCAVAGTWYNGTAYPTLYQNTFFQGDLGGTWLKSVAVDFTDEVKSVENFATGFNNLACITMNPLDGTLVTVEVMMGNAVKVINYGGNIPPVARISSDKTYGPTTLAVAFNGTNSFDQTVGGTISNYNWNFGDPASGVNNTSTLANPSHSFIAPAGVPTKFTVSLTVTDNGGATASATYTISVNNTPPVVNITSPIKASKYRVAPDSIYLCTATVSDAEHIFGDLKYAWQTYLRHNNHQHPEGIDTVRNTATRISRIGCNGDDYYWLVELTVTDKAGLSTKDSTKIFPECVGTLPIFLHKFSVTEQGGTNQVKWTTETEVGIQQFVVERSPDGVHFYPISHQLAKNLPGTQDYSFADNTYTTGDNYYRLKMVEIAAVTRYSAIIRISAKQTKNKLTIIPNPVVNNFSISFRAALSGTAEISVSDVSGRIVQQLRESVAAGNNLVYIQNMPSWNPGMYFVTVRQSGEVMQARFIKMQ